jgi:undecaprenyl-diphosphatase
LRLPTAPTPSRVHADLADLRAHWRRRRPGVIPLWPDAVALGVLALTALALVSMAFDVSAARAARTLPRDIMGFFQAVTHFGESNWLFALSILTFIAAVVARATSKSVTRRARAARGLLAAQALYVFTVLSVSGLVSQAVKHSIGRARPRLLDTLGPYHFEVFSTPSIYASFPSGHAITSFAVAAALGFLVSRRLRPLLWLGALLIAVSRVVVGAHYPSDVFGGALVGIASAYLIALAFARRKIVFTVAPDSLWPVARRLRPRRATAQNLPPDRP